MANIRNVWMIAHRWSGLAIAAFLIVASITGSVLVGWEEALRRGRELMAARAQREGFVLGRERQLAFEPEALAYVYAVASSLDIGDAGGDTEIMLSAVDGRELAFWHPGVNGGSAFAQWLAVLHMARVWGWPYRLFIFFTGFVIVALSTAGVIVWLKRRPA